jgi:hypothetical protein
MHRTLVAVIQLAKQGTLKFTGSQFWYINRMAPPTEADVVENGETVNGEYLFEEPREASAAAAIRSRARNAVIVPQRLLSLQAINMYWDYAVEDGASEHNVLPTAKNAGYATAAEIVFGKPAPVFHFHAFGQHGYVTCASNDRSPLHPGAILCQFLQAVNEHKYKVVQVYTNRVIT